MINLSPKNTRKINFLTTLTILLVIIGASLMTSCSKTSVSELDQMIAFAKKNNITYTTDSSGLLYQIINPGSGSKLRLNSIVSASYVGTFMNDKIFDSTSKPIDFPLNQVIKGWQIGLQKIAPGGEIKLLIPSSLGYGPNNYNSIPGGSPLYFYVKLAAAGCTYKSQYVNDSSATQRAQMIAFCNNNGITYTIHPSGILYQIITPGDAVKPDLCTSLTMTYTAKLMTGIQFDKGTITYPLKDLIVGWQIAVPLIGKGGKIKMVIPSSLAYGPNANGSIPANSPLYFEMSID
jgi:FKBP-type peptidyl-prolyl cis-trans isomerase